MCITGRHLRKDFFCGHNKTEADYQDYIEETIKKLIKQRRGCQTMDLLYSLEIEQERYELAWQMRNQLAARRPYGNHAPFPMPWEEYSLMNPDESRMSYQLWLYDVLHTVAKHDLDTHIGPLAEFTTSDKSCRAWVGRCKNPHGFKHWVSAPEIYPSSGMRHSSLEEAVRWAKDWIDMREELVQLSQRLPVI